MLYIFGKRLYDGKEVEFVKTVGDEYTNFPDGKFVTYVYDNGLMTITHEFRVLWKYKEAIDTQEQYNTWYYIDNHSKEMNNIQQVNRELSDHALQLSEQSDVIDDILIELLGGQE